MQLYTEDICRTGGIRNGKGIAAPPLSGDLCAGFADTDPRLVPLGKVPRAKVLLRAPAKPLLADNGGAARHGRSADDGGKARVSSRSLHCALGRDRLVRYRGFVRRLHPKRRSERSFSHSGDGFCPADLHERGNGTPVVPEVYLPAHRAGGCRPSLLQSRERRALARRAH